MKKHPHAIKSTTVAVMVWLVFTSNTCASLLSLDYQIAGDGLVTLDTGSGLEWLDISETLGVSVNQVLSGYEGFIDNGFRYASSEEVFSLFTNNNLIITGFGISTPNGYDDMVNLTGLLGGETDYGFSKTIHGLTADTNSSGYHDHIYFGYYYSTSYPREYWINPDYSSTRPDHAIHNCGSFLIREAIPEPTSICLLSLVTGGIYFTRRFFIA